MAFLNFDWYVSETVKLYLEGQYTKATFGFDPFELPEPNIPDTSPISPDNPHPISDYDYSKIGAYSDLDYSQVNTTVGANWTVARNRTIYGYVTVMDAMDDQPYVYGDMSGTLVLYAGGMTVNF